LSARTSPEIAAAEQPLRNTVVAMLCGFLLLGVLVSYLTIGPPNVASILLVVAVALFWKTDTHDFILSLVPFVAMLVCYESMRAFADDLTPFKVHVTGLITAERMLFFGAIPAAWAQEHIPYYRPVVLAFQVIYACHFVYPVVFALVLWFKRRAAYWDFMIGLMVMTYVGFLFYVLFPSAPPWWASHFGHLPEKILPHLSERAVSVCLTGFNPVAAFPSLHAGWSGYIALSAWRLWGRRGLWFISIPIGIFVATVYLGHHYVVDLLGGYALAWAVATLIQRRRPSTLAMTIFTASGLGLALGLYFFSH